MELLNRSALSETHLAALQRTYPWLERYPWQLCRYGKKEYLCRFREAVDRLVFLLEGTVSVSLTPPSGRTHIVTCATGNDLICGDMEVALGNTLASADLRAETEALCLFLPIAPHLEALREDNSFLRYALAHLSRQMANESIYTANNLLFPLENRMAAYVLNYAEGSLFRANLTRTAELMGVSYRQLSRVVRRYIDEGLLKKEPDGWRIIGADGLRDLARDIEEPL